MPPPPAPQTHPPLILVFYLTVCLKPFFFFFFRFRSKQPWGPWTYNQDTSTSPSCPHTREHTTKIPRRRREQGRALVEVLHVRQVGGLEVWVGHGGQGALGVQHLEAVAHFFGNHAEDCASPDQPLHRLLVHRVAWGFLEELLCEQTKMG